jgi:hypothetical protein
MEWVEDSVVDTATVSWLGVSPNGVFTRIEGAPQPLASLLTLFSWSFFPVLVRNTLNGEDASFNSKIVRFAANAEPGEPEFDGVIVENPLGQVNLGREAFERLVARFARVVVDGATRDDAPVIREPWWDEAVGCTEGLEAITAP